MGPVVGDVVELRDGPTRASATVPERRDAGRLVLVATPVGNLGDLSPRARAALADAALDLLRGHPPHRAAAAHAGVSGVRLAVCNEHTEAARIPEVLEVLGAGGDVAVVTDAGTPGICDPGERLTARRPRRRATR